MATPLNNAELLNRITELRTSGVLWKKVKDIINTEFNLDYATGTYRLYYNSVAADSHIDPIDHATGQRRASLKARQVNKLNQRLIDAKILQEDLLRDLKSVIPAVAKREVVPFEAPDFCEEKMTVELLLSDIQIGKLMTDFSSEIARKRLREYARASAFKISQHVASGYHVERIVLAMLGDIIESSKKHINSATSTDCSTTDQIKKAFEYLFTEVIDPLAQLGIPMDVVCVTGNHDHDGHGLLMFKPGREHYSWVFYHAIKMLAEARGYDHLKFNIPEGSFAIEEIYGHGILYEHGVGISVSESSMQSHLSKRANQLKRFLTYFRMGDKHNISRFNNDRLVVNGAFFGGDDKGEEFSGISGFDSNAAQIMLCHVKRKKGDRRLPIYDSFVIQLQHVR